MSQAWHLKDSGSVVTELGSALSGISSDEALSRLQRFGSNELVERARRSSLTMFFGQFTDFMILVLIAAALVSGVIGETSDTMAILAILILNACLGFTQEYRAEKALAALRKMAVGNTLALRNGAHFTIPATQLVPGDMVLVESGDQVPADLRIIEAVGLMTAEATLTGESVPVEKHANALSDSAIPVGGRKNMLFKGTFVTTGRGKGVVTETGMNTEFGKIAAMLQDQRGAKTPLQKRRTLFGKRLSIIILVACGIIFIGGMLRGEPILKPFLLAVCLAVAAIPEALPAVVTISLALGARRMVKQNVLVRKLTAVETLGSVSYICTDKTGTLTLNRMTVEEVWCNERLIGGEKCETTLVNGVRNFSSPQQLFMKALPLSNDARVDASGKSNGAPTEAAPFLFASDNGFEKAKLEKVFPRVAELSFDSEQKLMTTFHKLANPELLAPYISFTNGAVETMIDRSIGVFTVAGIQPFNRSKIEAVSNQMAADGLRVMAIGMRNWDTLPDLQSSVQIETGLTLLGLMGMMDPPREEAMQAVAECRSAGITTVMITGDHPLTAQTIAKRVGIIEEDDPNVIITGKELDALSYDEYRRRVEGIRVYARVAPEQKLKIVLSGLVRQ
ncbi:HAD-IC family P-type ATPase [Bdellovibrionota bacterium FG-2]